MHKTLIAAATLAILTSGAMAACPAGTVPPTPQSTALACEVGTVKFVGANDSFPWKFEIAESGNTYVVSDPGAFSLMKAASDGMTRAVVSKGHFIGGGGGVLYDVVSVKTPF